MHARNWAMNRATAPGWQPSEVTGQQVGSYGYILELANVEISNI